MQKEVPDPSIYTAHLSWWKRLKLALSTDPDDLPTEADPGVELRRRRTLRATLWGVSIALFLAFGAVPLYRAWNAWEARREAAVARRALSEGKFNEAWVSAQEALVWSPAEPVALRTLAEVAARTERWDRAVGAWEELARSGAPLWPGDTRARAVALLAIENASAALECLATLGERAEAADQVLRARALALSRRDAEAVVLLSKVLRDSATPAEAALGAVRELLNVSNVPRDDLSVAAGVVRRLATGRGNEALAAARLAASCLGGPTLEEGGLGEPLSAREVIQAVRGLPSGGLPAKLLALELELRLDPGQRDELMAAAAQEQARLGTVEALEMAAPFLLQHREAARLLEFLPQEKARESALLGRYRIEALAMAGKLREARVEAEAQQYPVEPDVEQALLARILTEAGDAKGAEKRWAAALVAAGQDRPKLRRIAQMAREAGAELTAEAAEGSVAALDRARGK